MKNGSRTIIHPAMLLSITLFIVVSALNTAQAETRTFLNPRYKGYAVDRCFYWGRQCDWPAANAFCRAAGYQKATKYKWDYMAPTRILGSGKICNTPGRGGCGGFTMINCYRPSSSSNTRTFNYPKFRGYYVDRCLYYGQQCNQPAANAFCKAVGYDRATYYKWDYMAPTRILATGQICNTPGRGGCGGFTKITCIRGGGAPPQPTGGGGRRPGGMACNENTDCRSGICLLGVCSE
jgi:hypothetical protein